MKNVFVIFFAPVFYSSSNGCCAERLFLLSASVNVRTSNDVDDSTPSAVANVN